MRRKNKVKIISVIMFSILCTLLSCNKGAYRTEKNEPSNSSELTEKNDPSESSKLAENIIANIDKWEYVCDNYTKKYTYDDIEATEMILYSTGKQGEYYFSALYALPIGTNTYKTYHQIFLITDYKFEYVYSSEYSAEDKTVANCKVLSIQFTQKGVNKNDKKECINKLADAGLASEKKYFNEITLNDTEPIEMNIEQDKLFNNMYAAIKELEYYDPRVSGSTVRVPLARIEYYDFGNGTCEMLLYHGYTSENIVGASFYVGGYLVDENGYSRLSYDDESKLKNTSKTIKLKWNVEWTVEKKEYILKQSISQNIK